MQTFSMSNSRYNAVKMVGHNKRNHPVSPAASSAVVSNNNETSTLYAESLNKEHSGESPAPDEPLLSADWIGHCVDMEMTNGKILQGVIVASSCKGEIGMRNVVIFPTKDEVHERILKKTMMKGDLRNLRSITVVDRAPAAQKDNRNFKTDADVSHNKKAPQVTCPPTAAARREVPLDREFVPFFSNEVVDGRFMSMDGDDEEDCLRGDKKGGSWWTPQEMLNINRDKFNLKPTTYNESEYTIPLDTSQPGFAEKLLEAEKIANEIEADKASAKCRLGVGGLNGNGLVKVRASEEEEDGSDDMEEDRFASVIRQEEEKNAVNSEVQRPALDTGEKENEVENVEQKKEKAVEGEKEPRWNIEAKEFVPGARVTVTAATDKQPTSTFSPNMVNIPMGPNSMFPYPPAPHPVAYTGPEGGMTFVDHSGTPGGPPVPPPPPMGLVHYPPGPMPFPAPNPAFPPEMYRHMSMPPQFPDYAHNVEMVSTAPTTEEVGTTKPMEPTSAAPTGAPFLPQPSFYPPIMAPFPGSPPGQFLWNGYLGQPTPHGPPHPGLAMPSAYFYTPGGAAPPQGPPAVRPAFGMYPGGAAPMPGAFLPMSLPAAPPSINYTPDQVQMMAMDTVRMFMSSNNNQGHLPLHNVPPFTKPFGDPGGGGGMLPPLPPHIPANSQPPLVPPVTTQTAATVDVAEVAADHSQSSHDVETNSK